MVDKPSPPETARIGEIETIIGDRPQSIEGLYLQATLFLRRYHDPEALEVSALITQLDQTVTQLTTDYQTLADPKKVKVADRKTLGGVLQEAADSLLTAQENREDASSRSEQIETRESTLRKVEDFFVNLYRSTGGTPLPPEIREALAAGTETDPLLSGGPTPKDKDKPVPKRRAKSSEFWKEFVGNSGLSQDDIDKYQRDFYYTFKLMREKFPDMFAKYVTMAAVDYSGVVETIYLNWTVETLSQFLDLDDKKTLPSTQRVLSTVHWQEKGEFLQPNSFKDLAGEIRSGKYKNDTLLADLVAEDGKKKVAPPNPEQPKKQNAGEQDEVYQYMLDTFFLIQRNIDKDPQLKNLVWPISTFAASRITGISLVTLNDLDLRGAFTGSDRADGAPLYTPMDIHKLMMIKSFIPQVDFSAMRTTSDLDSVLGFYRESDFVRAQKEYLRECKEEEKKRASGTEVFNLVVSTLETIQMRANSENMTNISWPVLSSVVSKLTNISDQDVDALYNNKVVVPEGNRSGLPLYEEVDVVKLILCCRNRNFRNLGAKDLRRIMDQVGQTYREVKEFQTSSNGI